jgi:type II secretory pathway pseudopilin PulG
MATDKGFTMLELLLAAVLTLALLGLSVPFFVAQSSYSYNSFQEKSSGEAVELALQLIRRDLLQAGYGVTNTAKKPNLDLSLFVVDGTGTPPTDTLYVNYTGYLNTRGDVENLPALTTAQKDEKAYIGANSVMMEGQTFPFTGGSIAYQGWVTMPSVFSLRGIPSDVTRTSIGALIYKTDGNMFADGASPVNVDSTAIIAESVAGYQQMTFYGFSIPTGRLVTPAIAYQVAAHGLWRNAGTVVPPTSSTSRVQPLLGGTQHKSLQVMDFQVRCQFRDSAGNTVWWPGSGTTFGSGTCQVMNLKQVEVTIAYRYWMKSGGLGATGRWNGPDTETSGGPRWLRKVITVSPRTVALKSS